MKCIGFGKLEGKCKKKVDSRSDYWCTECENERREHIQKQLEDKCGSIDDAIKNNTIVYRILKHGGSLEDVICALVNQQNTMQKALMGYYMICPRKFKIEDGKIMIWRCPDEMIPLIDIDKENKLCQTKQQ